jgi:hypothetical protein
MTDHAPPTRAALRRATLLTPFAQAVRLAPRLAAAVGEPPTGALERIVAYLCDPRGRAISVPHDDVDLAAWLGGPMFVSVGPRHVAPWSDEAAAIVAAGALTPGGALSSALVRWRFSPRADHAVAAAVAALPAELAGRGLEQLLRTPGPDEERLHLALLQAGYALAWSPAQWDTPLAEEIVARVLALLVPSSPQPLLDDVVRALRPLAGAATGAAGGMVREAAWEGLRSAVARIQGPRVASSFLDEVRDLARVRSLPDEDYWRSLPWRGLAQACARLLGAGAPLDPARFAAHQGAALADLPELVFEPFVEGLVSVAAAGPLEALFEALSAGDAESRWLGLELAARFPLDGSGAALTRSADAPDPRERAAAVAGLALLDGDAATEALARRLADPEPSVVAGAARALLERGAAQRVREAGTSVDHAAPAGAVLALVAGELSTRAIATVVNTLLAELDAGLEHDADGGSALVEVLAEALFGSAEGLASCADLVAAAPQAVPVIGLAATHGFGGVDPAVAVSSEEGAALASALLEVGGRGGEHAAVALVVLARLSCGERALVDEIAGALAREDGFAGHALTAASLLRVRDAALSSALTPLLGDAAPIGARVLACAAAGRTLPVEDPAWSKVEAMLGLGTVAASAAWASLRDRVRFSAS